MRDFGEPKDSILPRQQCLWKLRPEPRQDRDAPYILTLGSCRVEMGLYLPTPDLLTFPLMNNVNSSRWIKEAITHVLSFGLGRPRCAGIGRLRPDWRGEKSRGGGWLWPLQPHGRCLHMANQAWQPEHTNPAVSQAGRRIRKCHVSKEIISIFSPGRGKGRKTSKLPGSCTGRRASIWAPLLPPQPFCRCPEVTAFTSLSSSVQGQMDFTVDPERKGRVAAHQP